MMGQRRHNSGSRSLCTRLDIGGLERSRLVCLNRALSARSLGSLLGISSTGTGRSTLEILGAGVYINAVEESTALSTVAHTIVVVVSTVAKRTLSIVTVQSTFGADDHFRRNELAGSTIVRCHDGESLSCRESFVLDFLQATVGVINMDGLDIQFRGGHVNVDEFATITHGARVGITRIKLAAEHQARDLEMGRRQVVNGIQRDGDQILELGVMNGEGGGRSVVLLSSSHSFLVEKGLFAFAFALVQ